MDTATTTWKHRYTDAKTVAQTDVYRYKLLTDKIETMISPYNKTMQ